jgi:hypothetical protein
MIDEKTNPTPAPTPESPEPPAEKMLSQTEVNRVVRDLNARNARRAEKLVAEARAEGERLGRMSTEERVQVDLDRRTADLDARATALAEQEAGVIRRELRADAALRLNKKGLPPSLADALNYTDSDAYERSLSALERAFFPAVEAYVGKHIRRAQPPKDTGGPIPREAAFRAALGLDGGTRHT